MFYSNACLGMMTKIFIVLRCITRLKGKEDLTLSFSCAPNSPLTLHQRKDGLKGAEEKKP